MALLSDGHYVAVRIDDYAHTAGIDCDFSLTPDKLRRWSIDDGGRVLMNMDIGGQFPYDLHPDFEDFLHTLTESMIRIGRHKRRAHDGVAYTWTEFVEWYGHVQVAYEHWRRACPISFGYEMKLIKTIWFRGRPPRSSVLGLRLALFGPFFALGDMSVAGRSSGSGMDTQQSETMVKLGHNSASRQESSDRATGEWF